MAKHYNLAGEWVGSSEAPPPPRAPHPGSKKKPGRNRVNYPLVYVLRFGISQELDEKVMHEKRKQKHEKPSVLINGKRKVIFK